jgi:hypothetical protein
MAKNKNLPRKSIQQQLEEVADRLRTNASKPEESAVAIPSKDEIASMDAEMQKNFVDKLNTLERLVKDFTSKSHNIEKRLSDIKQKEVALTASLGDHSKREKALAERDLALVERERDIEIRELDARNGFVEQNRQALESLKEEIARLEAERNQVIARSEQQERAAHKRIEQERTALQDEIRTQREALDEEHRQLLDEKFRLELMNKRLDQAKHNQDAIEAEIRRSIEKENQRDVADLKRRIARAEENAENDEGTIQRLREELDDYADLRRLIKHHGFSDVDSLLTDYDSTKKENRRLREGQRQRPEDDLEGENESLRARCDEYEIRLEDQARLIGELRQELATSRVSVLEKQVLSQEKRVLEQHKRALDSAVTDLETRLDDLTKRQQGKEAFPALSLMDQELNGRVAVEEVPQLDKFALELRQRIAAATATPLYYSEDLIRLFLGGLAMSQLHILQGISGTGKTSLALAFAKAVGGHCTLVPVQAGWRDRDDLLGHFNAFERRFYERECLQAVYRASTERFEDRINIVLLDEMNLSHPEQYFAEFLSALERPAGEREVVLTETPATYPPVLLKEGRVLRVPDNLWFIGTANEDETTKGFADKTIDRAHVMELPRAKDQFDLVEPDARQPYSFSSLQERFRKAQKKHERAVKQVLGTVQNSRFTKLLEGEFNLGWGNRLERQAFRFVPVVVAAGGTIGEAFDHLLATRLFRAGKITERYDIGVDTLKALEATLTDVWNGVDSSTLPEVCHNRLEREIKRKEQQG